MPRGRGESLEEAGAPCWPVISHCRWIKSTLIYLQRTAKLFLAFYSCAPSPLGWAYWNSSEPSSEQRLPTGLKVVLL